MCGRYGNSREFPKDFGPTPKTSANISSGSKALSHSSQWRIGTQLRHRYFMRTMVRLNGCEFLFWLQIDSHEGAGLILLYKNSVHSLLQTNFPSHSWQFWKLAVAPQGFWADSSNQLAFCQWFASEKLGIASLEGWYSISGKTLATHGGALSVGSKFYAS